MLFAIGTKVRLKHTGDEGTITEMLSDGMLNVWIEAQAMEIPVFEEDLERAEDYENKHLKAKIIRPSSSKSTTVTTQKHDLQLSGLSANQGLLLTFIPRLDEARFVKKYQVYLINDTAYEFIFSAKVSLPNLSSRTIHGKLTTGGSFFLQDLLFDQLNDAPTFEIESWPVTTAGTGNKQHKTIKVKAKQFFKKSVHVSLLDQTAHVYVLVEKLGKPKAKKGEDLKTYTQQKVRPVRYQQSNYKRHRQHDVEEFANFSGEIDLHIENLPSRKGKMNNAEKLHLQLDHFDQFIAKAIRLGVPRIFIIHGIGKGKLRDIIASRLIRMPEVKTFKNEYHPRYGWGATEVIF
ncbi:MAG: Smr/MutS family protein [Bacteroidota bacterium]